MIIKVNNAEINFKYQLSYEDFMGESELHVRKKDMIDFISDNSDEIIDFEKYDLEESDTSVEDIVSFIEYDQDRLIDWIQSGMEDDFVTNNADLQIVLFYYLIDNDAEPISLD